MSKRIRIVILGGTLLIWGAAAWWIDTKNETVQKEYRERLRLNAEFKSLEKQWSAASQRKLQHRLDTILRIYNVRPDIVKRNGRKIYRFTLPKKSVDTVLNKILNMPLLLLRFEVEKADATHLKVRLEVPL